VTEKTGSLVGLLDVTEKEDLMITCASGVTIRMKVSSVSEQGRATQGVKLIRIDEGDEIAAITNLDEIEEEAPDAIVETTPEEGIVPPADNENLAEPDQPNE
jgi:DNA gyrase subunit A